MERTQQSTDSPATQACGNVIRPTGLFHSLDRNDTQEGQQVQRMSRRLELPPHPGGTSRDRGQSVLRRRRPASAPVCSPWSRNG